MYEIDTPTQFGVFHICAFIITILTALALCIFAKNMSDKKFRIMIGIWGIVLILFEVYKLTIFSIDIGDDNSVSFDFTWYAFPFQFCSTPLYVYPLVAILKESKVRNALIAFMGTFMLFAGLAVMCYTGDVFVRYLGVDIQTMLVHGSMLAVGIYTLMCRIKFDFKTLLSSFICFASFAFVALMLDLIFYKLLPDDTFNMYFISPYYPCTLPVLSVIYEKAPYGVFLICYLIGFCVVASLMFFTGLGANLLIGKIKLINKTKGEQENI